MFPIHVNRSPMHFSMFLGDFYHVHEELTMSWEHINMSWEYVNMSWKFSIISSEFIGMIWNTFTMTRDMFKMFLNVYGALVVY